MIPQRTKAAFIGVLIAIVGIASSTLSNEEKIVSPSNFDEISIELKNIKESIATIELLIKDKESTNIQTVNVGTDLSDKYLTEVRKTKNEKEKKAQQENEQGS